MYLAGGETSNNSNSDRDSEIMGPLPTTGSAVAPASWAALQPQNGQFGANINNGEYQPQSLIDGMDGLLFLFVLSGVRKMSRLLHVCLKV